ncbi:MAG: hypothetical protein COB36_00390 [Alphaproteobacteria bacterium]|nr:MAG: hypothetical protein COB36_00390 [Alphaproteobacteria bacterium]
MPIPEETQKKMTELDQRIKDARQDQAEIDDAYNPSDEELSPDAQRSARAGSEFLSTVIAGAFFGYGIDWYFNSTPIAMILFILLGFISGVMRANAAMKRNSEENEK